MTTLSLASAEFEFLKVSAPDADGIAVVTLNRPQVLNAIPFPMFDEVTRMAQLASQDDTVRALVLTGAGRGFCAGADLSAISDMERCDAPGALLLQEKAANSVVALKGCTKPVIAAINGACTGGGLAFALAADVRLTVPTAKFGVAFVRLGLSGCDVGVSWLLPRVVGLGHASELMLSGEVIGAAEAERIGLVNRIVEGNIVEAARASARTMVRNTAFGLKLTKQALQVNVDASSIQAAVELENRNQVLAFTSPEMRATLEHFYAEQALRQGKV